MVSSSLRRSIKKKSTTSFRNRRRRLGKSLEQLESRQLLASLAGEVWADTNGDGIRAFDEGPVAEVRVYIDANDDGALNEGEQFTTTDELGQYVFEQVQAGSHVVRLDLRFGQSQTSPTAFYGSGFTSEPDGTGPNPTQLFEMTSTGLVTPIGQPTTNRIHGLVRTNSGEFFGVNFENDSFYTIDGTTGQDTLLATSNIQLVAGLAYDPANDQIYAVGRNGTATNVFQLYRVDQDTGVASPVGAGLSGLQNVSDLTFDTVGNRIVGFDNATDRFLSFDTNGTGQFLATAEQPVDSFSLAHDGTEFLMFDRADPLRRRVLSVNPDTGEIATAFNASRSIPTEALVYPRTGDAPHRVTVLAADFVADLDFGVQGEAAVPEAERSMFISELLIDPLFGSRPTEQLIELRGDPNAVIPEGTYLVVVEEGGFRRGEVDAVFDLGNLAYGSNGFLVILTGGSPHVVHPNASVIQSSTLGFGGLPGDIFSSSSPISSTIDGFENGFFLIQSDVAPMIDDDIDTDDDGFADQGGAFFDWDVIDSIGLHTFSNSNGTFADILFKGNFNNVEPTINVPDGVEVIFTEGEGYAARLGDSVGSSAADWVHSTIIDQNRGANSPVLYELEDGIFGVPSHRAFIGRDLDHFGESNFIGGVRGTVALNPLIEGDPISDPASGVTVLADTNGNGRQDVLTQTLDPDNFFLGTSLTNVLSEATFTTALEDGSPLGFSIQPTLESFLAPNGNRVFAHEGINFFVESRKLRTDFLRPARGASIVGISGGPSTFIRLDAFDADDNLIGSVMTRELLGSAREQISLSFDDDVIAYTMAYSVTSFVDENGNNVTGSFTGMLDQYSYTQGEATTVTDEFGRYTLPTLTPDQYQITFINSDANRDLIGAQPVPIVINRFENFVLGPNLVPLTSDLLIQELAENSPTGTFIGQVEGFDDGGTVTFSILSDEDFGIEINAAGELVVGANGNLDFEQTPVIELLVGVTDNLGAVAVSTVSIELQDVNEAPIVEAIDLDLQEGTAAGTPIGLLRAFDPDTSLEQSLTFTVVGGSGSNVFDVDPSTGIVTIADDAVVDFETQSQLALDIRVSDSGDPVQETTYTQILNVTDVNDPPQLVVPDLTIAENSVGIIGFASVFDPDLGQTHDFSVSGGTGVSLFTVDDIGRISIRPGGLVDFESQSNYTLVLDVLDTGSPPLFDSIEINVSVTDVDEPATVVATSAAIGENAAAGTLAATLSIVDPEGDSSIYTASILDTADGSRFTFDPETLEVFVAQGAEFDFETERTNEIVIEVVDQTGNSPAVSVPITIEITNENDAPSLTESLFRVSERASAGAEFGTLRISDPDLGESFTSTILGGTGASLFELNPETHVLSVAQDALLDADSTDGLLTLNIEVTDGGGLTGVGTISIALNNVNEPPVFNVQELQVPQIDSGEDFQFVLPEDLVFDPEGGDFSISIVDNNGVTPPWISFDAPTRTISALASPEEIGTQNLTIRAFEFGGVDLATELDFTISVAVGATPLNNQRDPTDVNNDGNVRPLDALNVISFISAFGFNRPVSTSLGTEFTGFLDVDGNGLISALDAYLVIDRIRNDNVAAQAELISFPIDNDDDEDEREDAVDAVFAESTLF